MLRFLPSFAHVESPGEWHDGGRDAMGAFILGGFEYPDFVDALMQAAYDHGWVLTDDWFPWQREAESWTTRPEQAQSANSDALARCLTVYLRREHFADGAFAEAIGSGLVLALLQRMREIAEQIERGSLPVETFGRHDHDRYVEWLLGHSAPGTGYVLNRVNQRRLVLHRSDCPKVNKLVNTSRFFDHRAHTSSIKFAAEERASLDDQARAQTGAAAIRCSGCFKQPNSDIG